MLYIALIAFFVLMGRMIRDLAHAERDAQDAANFYRSEYTVPFAK